MPINENGDLTAIINEGITIPLKNVSIENGRLYAQYVNGQINKIENLEIINGRLIVYYKEDNNMAKIDLGQVVGPAGPKGDKGDRGTNGTNGISPTFTIENGHLYADYDHPVNGINEQN